MQLCFAELVDICTIDIYDIYLYDSYAAVTVRGWRFFFFLKIMFSYILQIQSNCKISKIIQLSSEIRLFISHLYIHLPSTDH